ncbi:uncharacterized protein LOC128555244 [Mercenaria mercenaria]|uniref:uncharacterized protein LOC128555244 n=1 Tax=Mercenaria mercenaria TaxID=6596 RepID=UPI00234FB2F8|nr:uncharacterized protein LOC128555244 [Mercenaria mercenaria]
MLTESLREDLIIHYRTNCSTVPLSPLIEERDVPLAKLDVPQKLVSVDLIKTFYQFEDSPSQTPVKSYKDLFFCGSEHYRNIYITAKAGVGKTLLSKKLCLIWCQAHKQESSAIFKGEDIDAIRTFDFLFFLTLGEADSSDCDIDDMIQTQVITKLSHHYTKEFLTDILHSKACLIILDGLDEWSHSNISAPGCRPSLIPQRKARSKCTILTTTRPWKLNALRIKDSQIDKHVRICELDEDTSAKLIENAVSLLNGRSKPPKSAKKIQEAVAKSKLDEMRFIPYIILQFVCLLFDGKPISRSKCELYSNIVELILSRGRAKLRHTQSYVLESKQQLPRCFINNEECKENYGLLLLTGRLAFEELFSEDEECSSIFEKTTVLKYMPSYTLDMCLNLGLLTQSKTNDTVAFRHIHFAFQHKSMQEYFAALYAQSKHEPKILERVKQKILNKCQSLPSDLDLSAVFVFICGFQQEFARDLLQSVLVVMSETEIISEFRTTSSIVRSSIVNSKIVKHFQRLVADCWKESLNSGHMEMRLLVQDIVIDKNTTQDDYLDALKSFVELGKNNLKSMCVHECVSANEANNVLQKLNTQNICYLRKLELRSIPEVLILQALLRRSKTSLRCLDLCSFKFGKSAYRYYNEEINLPSEHLRIISEMEYLQVLTLASFCMSHNDMDLLLRFLTRKTSMRQIVLYRIRCTKNNTCNGHTLDLSLHENLQVFGLDNIPLSRFILKPASLEECWIGQLPSHILSKIFADLQNSRNLHTLYRLKHDDICAMLQSLPSLCQVKHLSF